MSYFRKDRDRASRRGVVRSAHYCAVLSEINGDIYFNIQDRKTKESSRREPEDSSIPHSRKRPFLLFDADVGIDAFKHEPRGDLGEFFGFDFVEASALDAAFRNQLGGFANRFFTVPFGVWSGPCCRGRW